MRSSLAEAVYMSAPGEVQSPLSRGLCKVVAAAVVMQRFDSSERMMAERAYGQLSLADGLLREGAPGNATLERSAGNRWCSFCHRCGRAE